MTVVVLSITVGSMRVRVLTVRQPYADLILRGEKTLELRTWVIAPGPLAIHAAKWKSTPGHMLCLLDVGAARDSTVEDCDDACCDIGPQDDWWAHPLSNVRPVRQDVVSGKLGIWYREVVLL